MRMLTEGFLLLYARFLGAPGRLQGEGETGNGREAGLGAMRRKYRACEVFLQAYRLV